MNTIEAKINARLDTMRELNPITRYLVVLVCREKLGENLNPGQEWLLDQADDIAERLRSSLSDSTPEILTALKDLIESTLKTVH